MFKEVYGFTTAGHGDTVQALEDNKAVILENAAGEIVDIFGVAGIDGTGADWNYEGKIAKRKIAIKSGNTSWDASEWEIITASDVKTEATPGTR